MCACIAHLARTYLQSSSRLKRLLIGRSHFDEHKKTLLLISSFGGASRALVGMYGIFSGWNEVCCKIFPYYGLVVVIKCNFWALLFIKGDRNDVSDIGLAPGLGLGH